MISYLEMWGHEVKDFGAKEDDPAEYPKFAYLVSKAVINNKASRGILISETGLDMAVAANKVNGIRVTRCANWQEANFSREVLSANVLCIGENVDVWQVVDSWLSKDFDQKHADAITQILEIEAVE